MRTLSSTEAQKKFDALPDMVRRESVQVLAEGKPSWVAVSVENFRRLSDLEAEDRAQRQAALDALTQLQEQIAAHNLTDAQKRDILGPDVILE